MHQLYDVFVDRYGGVRSRSVDVSGSRSSNVGKFVGECVANVGAVEEVVEKSSEWFAVKLRGFDIESNCC